MSRHVPAPALALSHLLASPAVASSPVPDASHPAAPVPVPWDAHLQPACTAILYSPTQPPPPPSPAVGLASYAAYAPTPAPAPASVLKTTRVHRSPSSEPEQTLCLPTHQVLGGMPPAYSPSPSPSPPPETQTLPRERLAISIARSLNAATASSSAPSSTATVPQKRAATSAVSTAMGKKPRAATSTKDFVPPDVSGLSKREARLVKNRAAAFLSRQRKREEFENMEIRVAELEQENARLLALAQSAQQQQLYAMPGAQEEEQHVLQSEVDELRKQLAAAQQRTEELERRAKTQQHHLDTRSPSPTPSATSTSSSEHSDSRAEQLQLRSRGEKGAASLGLMVLLCALPTLLSSMPSQPRAFSLPLSAASSFNSASSSLGMHMPGYLPSSADSFDWAASDLASPFSGSSYAANMDLGAAALDFDLNLDDAEKAIGMGIGMGLGSSKLEFVNDAEGELDGEAGASALPLAGLEALDISFDARPASGGKIRVRIHPPASSAAPSAAVSSAPSPAAQSSADSPAPSQSLTDEDHPMSTSELGAAAPSPSPSAMPQSQTLLHPDADADSLGPFLGIGAGLGKEFGIHEDELGFGAGSPWDFDFDSGFSSSQASAYGYGSRAGSPGAAGRRRVRIALKSVPGRGHEGGEWEVEVC